MLHKSEYAESYRNIEANFFKELESGSVLEVYIYIKNL